MNATVSPSRQTALKMKDFTMNKQTETAWVESGVSLHDVIRRHADLINNGKSLLSWYQVLLAATHDRPFQRHEFQNVLHLAMESLSRAYQEDRGRWVLHAMTTATWCNSVSH